MSHDHSTDSTDSTELFTQEFWDARYSTADAIWSGNPNVQLVEHVAELAPGTALDVGCGEGADAIWLAERGWQVTGIDVSSVALARAAAQAARAGVADRTSWEQADLASWDPTPRQFDLVSAQFIQLPRDWLQRVHRRLAAAVRPGGTLFIVGHHPQDELPTGLTHLGDLRFTGEQVAAALDPADWQIVAVASPARQARDPDGNPMTIHDAVMHAVRR
jgi:2-polyprenyl-3-methyl-5-hydroxy-6-metoxy-1,4-benzoquinol methylase